MKSTDKPSQETLDAWHADPSSWKLGVIYYNKQDKRIFPPKRVRGMGWTVNFANPYSILALVALLAATILMIKYLS
ncbi:MAG: DUF5808 domain-containing protein [Mariniphaga sp.]